MVRLEVAITCTPCSFMCWMGSRPAQLFIDWMRLWARPAPWQELHQVSGLPQPTMRWLALPISPGTKTGCPVLRKEGGKFLGARRQRRASPLCDGRKVCGLPLDQMCFKFGNVVADIIDEADLLWVNLEAPLEAPGAPDGGSAGDC